MREGRNRDMTKGYDPVEYWTKAGVTYFQKFVYSSEYLLQEEALMEYLSLLQFRSVLDLGCGFGRIADKILKRFGCRVDKYTCVDVSKDQIEHAQLYLLEYNNVNYKVLDIQDFFPLLGTYDLVIAVEVLMHQLPSEIEKIIKSMISVSKKHVINVDYFSTIDEELEPHNFNHNYFKLYPYMVRGTKIAATKQWIFHVEK
jgi:2-polyprenyl-3-methyl-5-hydroxy-6-metoxy-1,4-benzoquinol methylase